MKSVKSVSYTSEQTLVFSMQSVQLPLESEQMQKPTSLASHMRDIGYN